MGQLSWNSKFVGYLQQIDRLTETLRCDRGLLGSIEYATQRIVSILGAENKILIVGNGGSAAHAQHFAAELVGKFGKARRAFPVVALTTDTSIITAWGNDCGFEHIFSRQIEALGLQGDLLVALSTSGISPNIVAAWQTAQQRGMETICLLGKGGGTLGTLGTLDRNHCIVVPSDSTHLIQDVHQWILHHWCVAIEEAFFEPQ